MNFQCPVFLYFCLDFICNRRRQCSGERKFRNARLHNIMETVPMIPSLRDDWCIVLCGSRNLWTSTLTTQKHTVRKIIQTTRCRVLPAAVVRCSAATALLCAERRTEGTRQKPLAKHVTRLQKAMKLPRVSEIRAHENDSLRRSPEFVTTRLRPN